MAVEFYNECKTKISEELLNFQGTKISILETSHRSKIYESLHDDANKNLAKLLNIPSDFAVLWFQGERELQYGAICMNLVEPNKKPSYILTGESSKKAYEDAKSICGASVAFDLKDAKNFDSFEADFNSKLKYKHDDAFLFFVDEEDSNGFALPVPKGGLISVDSAGVRRHEHDSDQADRLAALQLRLRLGVPERLHERQRDRHRAQVGHQDAARHAPHGGLRALRGKVTRRTILCSRRRRRASSTSRTCSSSTY